MDLSKIEPVKRNSGIPLYRQISDTLRQEIMAGQTGSVLPNERILAESFGVERLTLRKAIQVLIHEGLIEKHRGRSVITLPLQNSKPQGKPTKHTLFAYIITTVTSEYHAELCAALEKAARRLGLNSILKISGYDANHEAALIQQALEEGIKGLIVSPVLPTASMHIYRQIQETNFPLVFLGREVGGLDLPSVTVSDGDAMELLVNHLVAEGHQQIGYLTGSLPSIIESRKEKFQRALHLAGLKDSSQFLGYGDGFHREAGAQAAKMLCSLQTRPTALIAHNDIMALGAIDWLTAHQYRVPEDVAVAGFDNLPAGALASTPLTTIGYSIPALADLAVCILKGWMNGTDSELKARYQIQPELIIRQSTSAQWKGDECLNSHKSRWGYFV